MSSLFRDQIRESAQYLIERRNPKDGGWGLNIESGYQASSIVNTTEALYVIKASGELDDKIDQTINFMRRAITEHPKERGDNLRYLTFGVLGMLFAGLDKNDTIIQHTLNEIEGRFITKNGWKETKSDENVRLWPTFQCLWVLTKVYGADYVKTKYHDCLSKILRIGKENGNKWGFVFRDEPSLAATSYVLILLSEIYQNTPDTHAVHATVTKLLEEKISSHKPLEVEAISGTDWHHYAYCWGLKSIQYEKDYDSYTTTTQTLNYIAEKYIRGKGYPEPGKKICNVRSIFNNVLVA